jgi:hypothetical protein
VSTPEAKRWSDAGGAPKRDVAAAIAVALVGLPLCLGSSAACGPPLFSGLTARVVRCHCGRCALRVFSKRERTSGSGSRVVT